MAYTVSTTCPSCGGGLNFEEGANAVRCDYCGSSHVATGHGRVLSYYIPEKIDAARAVSLALGGVRQAGGALPGGLRAREATLFFVPFYRFLGQVLRWEVQDIVVDPGEGGVGGTRSRAMGWFSREDLAAILTGGPGAGAPGLAERRFELAGRHTDRTLPAVDAPGLGTYSLGLRPETLRLLLFEKDTVGRRGRIVPAGFTYQERETFGFAPVDKKELFARCVFAKTRSVIYFPFWVVETGGGAVRGGARLVVVDGVSKEVTNADAPLSLLDTLLGGGEPEYEVVGFRPLKCPDCANDLPVRPRDVVFICASCAKAWYIQGSGLTEIPCTFVRPKAARQGEPTYLPFWVIRAVMRSGDRVVDNRYELARLAPGMRWPKEEDKAVPLRFFVPAFRMGNMKALSRLASGFTRYQPVLEGLGVKSVNVRGCFISPSDALELAPLILFSLVPKTNKHAVRFALEAEVEPAGAELVLIPYYKEHYEYRDGLFGWSMPAAAVK